jgi:hypothetical protein
LDVKRLRVLRNGESDVGAQAHGFAAIGGGVDDQRAAQLCELLREVAPITGRGGRADWIRTSDL